MKLGATASVLLIVVSLSTAALGERQPIFVGSVLSSGGETRLDLKDKAVPIALPPVFEGWLCYIDETQRAAGAYIKKITCGGKWGFVDGFVQCDSKHRRDETALRLRQPIFDDKKAVDSAEKVTITVGCSY